MFFLSEDGGKAPKTDVSSSYTHQPSSDARASFFQRNSFLQRNKFEFAGWWV